ncbi:putative RNA-directed DNA polymerase, eukaryota, reverse transcriptase zinc-binding domain protein [Tanacetum coccineum]
MVVYFNSFTQALLDKERFLKQKSKIDWLKVGNSNSAFFHRSVKERVSRTRIDCIHGQDNVVYEGSAVPHLFVNHYTNFLGTKSSTTTLNQVGLFGRKLNASKAEAMIREVTNEEIKRDMFLIGNDKAPSPNSYTSVFYKKAWNIVGNDVCSAVHDFFVNGKLLQEVNHTILTLLPKVSSPSKINDFRPISCCNVNYKCISKIITNRIKDGLNDIVSDNQSAFILGCSIWDNILLTQELMHNYHLNRGPPRCACKIDIQKAYDTVCWKFLNEVLIGFGFHEKMIKWIMACVTSTSFSININGDLNEYFKGKRGLRQRDLISPYLFTLVMEILTLILKCKIRKDDAFKYHNKCDKQKIVNICFTDDLILFVRAEVHSAKITFDVLEEFKEASGLVPSTPKSTVFLCNVLDQVKSSILNLMPFEEGILPIKYLGVPLISTRLLHKDCKILVERVQKRIRDWKNKWLSFAGRA